MAGIVIWGILVGSSFTFVNGIGLFAVAVSSPGGPGVDAALVNSTCKISASGIPYNCTGNVNAPGSGVSTIFTFGYFLWSFVQAIPTIMEGALVPGSLAQQWFGGVGVVVNAAMLLLAAFWAWAVVGNRKPDFTPE